MCAPTCADRLRADTSARNRLLHEGAPDYAKNNKRKVAAGTASNISYYKSKQVQVYEFTISATSSASGQKART